MRGRVVAARRLFDIKEKVVLRQGGKSPDPADREVRPLSSLPARRVPRRRGMDGDVLGPMRSPRDGLANTAHRHTIRFHGCALREVMGSRLERQWSHGPRAGIATPSDGSPRRELSGVKTQPVSFTPRPTIDPGVRLRFDR
jgi:hypothetical protein